MIAFNSLFSNGRSLVQVVASVQDELSISVLDLDFLCTMRRAARMYSGHLEGSKSLKRGHAFERDLSDVVWNIRNLASVCESFPVGKDEQGIGVTAWQDRRSRRHLKRRILTACHDLTLDDQRVRNLAPPTAFLRNRVLDLTAGI
ncbi:hypothetical protein Tco_1226350 [Tanacetum coccineum]